MKEKCLIGCLKAIGVPLLPTSLSYSSASARQRMTKNLVTRRLSKRTKASSLKTIQQFFLDNKSWVENFEWQKVVLILD